MGFDAGGGPQYGNVVGGIFVFNLIVGVGALSLPNGFAYAGLVRWTIDFIFLAIEPRISMLPTKKRPE